MYRADGPEAMRPVGETEFVNGVAAMSASGGYGPTRACAGIVGYADLALGDDVKPVLEAHIDAGNGRFRGIRHAAGWHPSPDIRNYSPEGRPAPRPRAHCDRPPVNESPPQARAGLSTKD